MEFTPVSCQHQLDLVRVGSLVQRVHSVPVPGVAIWGLSDHSVVPAASWSVAQRVVYNEGICLTHFAENFFPASSFRDVMSVGATPVPFSRDYMDLHGLPPLERSSAPEPPCDSLEGQYRVVS